MFAFLRDVVLCLFQITLFEKIGGRLFGGRFIEVGLDEFVVQLRVSTEMGTNIEVLFGTRCKITIR